MPQEVKVEIIQMEICKLEQQKQDLEAQKKNLETRIEEAKCNQQRRLRPVTFAD